MAGIRKTIVGLCVVAATAVGATPAVAADLLSARLSSTAPVFRSCADRVLASGDGVTQRQVSAPRLGWVTARLDATSGDWDVAVFDRGAGALVAGAASFGGHEVASGVTQGGDLTVQACRLSGSGQAADLDVDFDAIGGGDVPRASLVKVATPNRARRNELASLGLDLTEHGGPGFLTAVLYGPRDARILRRHKFAYTTQVADVAARDAADRRADARYAGSVRASTLPSGRDTYRRLSDYGDDMKKLVRENPGLVKPITLPFRTWTGMPVEGVEITTDVQARDGKPVFLQMGAHHAREWPSSEHAMEWAFELVNSYRSGDPRVRDLVSRTRTIVIPLVNPEGFNTSREAGQMAGAGNGRGGPDETPNLLVPYEYQRKNCRVNNTSGDDPPQGNCQQQPATGFEQFGVDPNRNYGGFWGGPGASADGGTPPGDYEQDYRGNGPFSEPETQNIRDLVSKRHVTTLITNHTFSNLVLRPPGIQAQGPSFDEPLYKELGRTMAQENGYKNQPSYRLYDTTGTTEDWTYYTTGGLGFTFEIGPTNFHPPFQETVNEYEGNTAAADPPGRDGRGNREAYFKALENTANSSRHSLLAGRAQGGAILRLAKSFKTSTSPVLDASGEPGQPILFDDKLDTTMEVPGSNQFSWHINPSTRPIVGQSVGRPNTGSPSPAIEKNDELAPLPPCPTYFELGSASCPSTSYHDEPFDVPPNGGGVDNGFVTIRIEWTSEDNDFDLEIFRDANGDGDLDDQNEDNEPESDPIASSAQGGTNWEETTIGPDPAPGKYYARVINFAGGEPYDLRITFKSPLEPKPGGTETWRLTCETFSGTVMTSQDVLIARGEQKDPGLQACIAAFQRAFGTGRGCDRPTGRVFRKGLDRARLGRDREDHLRRYRIGLKGRRNLDKFCLSDRRAVRIGYPSSRILRQNRGRARGSAFASNKAVLVLTSSRRFRVRRVRVGMRPAVMRSRIGRRIRPIRIGANRWYVKRGRAARLLFKVRAGRVREVGHTSLRLTNTRRKTARLLRSFPLR